MMLTGWSVLANSLVRNVPTRLSARTNPSIKRCQSNNTYMYLLPGFSIAHAHQDMVFGDFHHIQFGRGEEFHQIQFARI